MTTLSDAELERYARQIVLPEFGALGQRKLKAASIVVVGAGGIGSAAIPALAGSGAGRLRIIDSDQVEMSNLHRQTIYRADQAGKPKAALAAAYARALNSHVDCEPVDQRLEPDNAAELLAGHDIIVDGCDNFATRLAVSDAATQLRIPLISAAVGRFQAQVAQFRGWEDGQPCYRCFVGNAFDADDCDNCAETGVLGPLVGMAGQFAAFVAIMRLAGVGGDRAGQLHLFDGLGAAWRTIRIPQDPACRTCGD